MPRQRAVAGDPSVGVVLALAEGMPDALAGDAELGVGADEVAAGVHDLGPGDLRLHAPEAGGTQPRRSAP